MIESAARGLVLPAGNASELNGEVSPAMRNEQPGCLPPGHRPPAVTMMAAEVAATHLGRKMLAEKRRHQLLANGTRGFSAMDSADTTLDVDALVRATHGTPTSPTETDWWWKMSLGGLHLQQKPVRNLLHVKTVNSVVSLEGWPQVLEYIENNPIVWTSLVVPSLAQYGMLTIFKLHAAGSPSKPTHHKRLFVFNTPRSDMLIQFLKWLDDFEKACRVKHVNLDSWKIFADLIRFQHQASSWHFVWNLDPTKHHRFLMTKQPSGPNYTASFAISMTELLLLSTRLPQLRRSGFTWRPTFPSLLGFANRSTEPSDLSSDHRAKFKFAPRSLPSELLLSLDSQVITKRPLLYVKHLALDIAFDPASGCIVDITTSDVGDHINLLPLLYKRDFLPIDLVVRLFDQEVDRWTSFIKAYGSHIKALRTYLYDNLVQKATINTILTSLKLVDSLLLIAQNNAETIDQFLSDNVYNEKPQLPYFWMWRHPAASASTRVNHIDPASSTPADPASSTASSTSSSAPSRTSSQVLLSQACPTQYEELRRDKEYFLQVQDLIKGWEVDLRGQMQLIFNLISIDEAYRSREQNTSLKRLSWITFIFLPMLFMSSLFGMNIDLLVNNPAWWWYLVWTAPALALVLLFWFGYRVWDLRRVAEEELPFKMA
ncbi:hypothetical protein Dda_9071 [Drechslerella dactyloides]|uniref:Uncharacterized protein n=1 Tax=Drechslerella dactyloides TaxID=74499 RepID=A0AAD6IQ31_DREDA|nr:hypothetical protein Dda_9071 [Drechslerella dactyloides]